MTQLEAPCDALGVEVPEIEGFSAAQRVLGVQWALRKLLKPRPGQECAVSALLSPGHKTAATNALRMQSHAFSSQRMLGTSVASGGLHSP